MSGKLRVADTPAIVFAVVAVAYEFLSNPEKSDKLELYGNVEVRQVDLAFSVKGRPQDMLVEEGDRVKAGQPLAHIAVNYFDDTPAVARARGGAHKCSSANRPAGKFKVEITPTEIRSRKRPEMFSKDEHHRPDMTLVWRAKLKSALWKDGLIAAANAPVLHSSAATSIV